MRTKTSLFLLLFLFAPLFAAADFVPMGPSSRCPKGSAGDPSGPPKTFSFTSPAAEVRSYLNRRILCPSACFDEVVTLNVSTSGITVTVAAQNKCKKTDIDPQGQDATKNNRGCAKEQTNPRVAAKITGLKEQLIPAKSRCDVSNLSRVIDSVAEQRLTDALASLDALAKPLVGAAVIAPVNLETPAGQKVLAGQLATAFQITPDKAEAIVAKDPEAALRAIYAVAQGDETAIKAEAKSLGLNPDLTDRVALNAKLIQDGNLTEPDESGFPSVGGNTFRELRAAIADSLAPLCGQLGGCSATACQNNPGSLTCRTNNPGALTWAPWEAKYGGQPCGQNNNTTCFPSLEQGLAAKIALLTSSRYLGGDNNTILKMLCNGYSSNAAGNNCNSYAAFVQNQTGIPMNQTIDPRNPEQVGKIAMAISRMENGRFVPFTPQQLEDAMSMVYGGTLPDGTPGFIAKNVFGTNGGTSFGSPFGLGTSASPATVGYGSAFGRVTPAPISQPIASVTQPTVTPTSQTTAQPVTNPQVQASSSEQSDTAKRLEDALQDPSTKHLTTQSPASIVVQPKEVRRGDTISVSWASIGMSPTIPCVLRTGSTVLAKANKGSSVVPTTDSTRIGSMIFTLKCTTLSGVEFQRTAAVMVR